MIDGPLWSAGRISNSTCTIGASVLFIAVCVMSPDSKEEIARALVRHHVGHVAGRHLPDAGARVVMLAHVAAGLQHQLGDA